MKVRKLFRHKAILLTVLLLVLVAVLYRLYMNTLIERTVESVGAEIVGAKVDLASARLRLREADLELTGLQVADPNAPMTNLVEIPTIQAGLNARALLFKKVVVESLFVRGVRFGTPRTTSGALDHPSPTTGLITRRVLSWANGIHVPPLDLRGLVGTVVRVPAVNADSLRTPRQARHIVTAGDSLRAAWDAELRGLDARPTADSARALAARLQAADPRRMNAAQLASTANDIRTTLARVAQLRSQLDTARAHTTAGVAAMRANVDGLDDARRADLAFVRGLVHIPSFEAPDVSMSLFGTMVTERLKPVMYWVGVAEQYIPPGLDPRRKRGPDRARMSGTTFEFPRAQTWPAFLVEHAAADLAIGGRTAAAGSYAADVRGVTTEPAVYGRPLYFSASRRSSVGPQALSVGGYMDRSGGVPRDSLRAVVPKVTIPSMPVPVAGATLSFGDSSLVEISLARTGAALRGTWRLSSGAVHWTRASGPETAGARAEFGSAQWAADLVWSAVQTLPNVDLVAHIDGPLTAPNVSVTSNVGDALSASIKRVMGAEIARAEAQVRAKVDSIVSREVAAARAKADALRAEVQQRVEEPARQLEQIEADLKAQLQRYTSTVPGNIRLPQLPRLPGQRPTRSDS